MQLAVPSFRSLKITGAVALSFALASCGGGTETTSETIKKAATTKASAPTQTLDLEKRQLKFGFIKLTDMAPLAIAYEKGYFKDEGLFVTIEAQANWKILLDNVIDGSLDGAHMLAGQPLGATVGIGTKADVVTAFSMDLNGNGITVSNEVWEEMNRFYT